MRVAIPERLLAWWQKIASAPRIRATRDWLSMQGERADRRLAARGRAILGWLAVAAVLVWFQGGAVLESLETHLTSSRVNDDALQQIVPFFRYSDDPSAFENDYAADYYLACYPLGYWALYAFTATLGLDPTHLSRVLPHLTWLTAVVGLGAVANKLGGKLAALCAMALALGSNAYLYRTAGGLPRGFGFPILSLTLVSLAYARVWWCAACVLLGALFYPVTAVISGLSLAGILLFPKVFDVSERSWSWTRRFGFLAGTAALAALLLVPSTVSASRFGGVVRPTDAHEFPEAARGGRYDANSRPPFKGFFASIPSSSREALTGGAPQWSRKARAWLGPKKSEMHRAFFDVLLVMGVLGGAALLVRQPAARRVLALGVAAAIGYQVARFIAPYAYLPDRYVAYPIPLLSTLLVAVSVAGLFPRSFDAGWRRWVKWASVGAQASLLLAFLGGRVAPGMGLKVGVERWKPLVTRIAALPPDALLAGWPHGAMDRIPYATRRRALVTHEVHQAFHKGYTLEMRRRMFALIEAYYATSLEPLIALRDDLGVTHILLERSRFQGMRPRYFKPFDQAIAKQFAAAQGKEFELPKLIERASIFSHRDFELLDLSKIDDSSPANGERSKKRRKRRR